MTKNYVSRKKKQLDTNYPYKSGLEKRLAMAACKGMPYENLVLDYVIEKKYNPDFIWEDRMILFEAKGRFRDQPEYAKHKWITKAWPGWELVFIFEDPNIAMPGAKPRKDGTLNSHGEWATANGYRWCSVDNATDWINNEKNGINQTIEDSTSRPARVRKSRGRRTRSKS